MIIAKDLSKHFGEIKAVDGLSFSIKKGEIVGLLGPNGAGKTTLIRLITGYLEPSRGKVGLYENKQKLGRIEALEKIGYVPEHYPLYGEMTPYEFLKFCQELRGLSEESIKEAVAALNLKSILNQKIETLSKGYKRRVGLAAGIIHKPEVLILDEPTEGLDPNQKFELRNFIKAYGKNKIVLLSTHIMEEVEAMTTRILLLKDGKLLEDTTPEGLKNQSPKQDISTSFRKLTTAKAKK